MLVFQLLRKLGRIREMGRVQVETLLLASALGGGCGGFDHGRL